MAAPSPTARQTGSGRKMGDGFPIVVTFSLDPDIDLWEKEVTPAGLEGDTPNDTSTQHNETYRTKSPRSLISMTECTITCLYDPILHTQMEAIINRPQVITEWFPDGSSVCYYGFVQKFTPGSMSEGNVPTATVTVMPTNQDPNTCAEEGPTYTPGSGTASSC